MYKEILKPGLDFLFALLCLLLLSPLFFVVWITLSIANHGSPLFFQKRPGKNFKLFKLIKFKTMTDAKDVQGNLLPDNKRLTKTGDFIRKTSLDEFPQLLNVLKGNMSLVGPRPLLEEYLPLYSIEQSRRHLVKPGITGWAQVNGRNSLSWEERFILDVWYVENQTFFLDLKILCLTVVTVVKRDGVSSPDTITMSKFTGK